MQAQTRDITLDVDVLFTNNNLRETVKLTFNVDTLANTSIYELKVKLQDLINVPVCDQKLSYFDQLLTDPASKLADLYLRDGDTLSLECPEKIDIKRLTHCIDKLKEFKSLVSPFCTSDAQYVRLPAIDDVGKLEDLYADICEPLENLADLFGKWKTSRVKVERHYFIQENGLEYLMEILGFSQKKYDWFPSSLTESSPVMSIQHDDNNEDNNLDFHDENESMEEPIETDVLAKSFNEWQLILNSLILTVLWNFMEKGPETTLVLKHGGLQAMIGAYLRIQNDVSFHFVQDLRENALGCICGCVEYDPNVQREVAANKELMRKFVQEIHHGFNPQSHPGFHDRRQECCLIANTLFYISFDQKAIKILIESGIHLKIMKNVQNTVRQPLEIRKTLIICYYCLLFLARVRSSTLVTIPDDQACAIDTYIDTFIKVGHKPDEIGVYEEETVYVWMTLSPIVHMTFARGLATNKNNLPINQNKDAKELSLEEVQDEDDICFRNPSEAMRSSDDNDSINWDTESYIASCSDLGVVQWPGSKAVQDLGIFALHHTLFSDDNVELLISENLHPYLVCLLWQLQGPNRDKLNRLLQEKSAMSVPLLSVICKSILARVNGFDAVRNV